jgi:hypothetical protein
MTCGWRASGIMRGCSVIHLLFAVVDVVAALLHVEQALGHECQRTSNRQAGKRGLYHRASWKER